MFYVFKPFHALRFFLGKIDMVKSKCGLAISACFTVVASLGMSLSLCVAVGLMSPALRGRYVTIYCAGRGGE